MAATAACGGSGGGQRQPGGAAPGQPRAQQVERRHPPDDREAEEVHADHEGDPAHRGPRGVQHVVDDHDAGDADDRFGGHHVPVAPPEVHGRRGLGQGRGRAAQRDQ
ncbi:hypothetical protein ACFVZ4_00960 [Streptomyces goshikiensis]|uniref:hypothetical protein n=1 Tax=Streptomyces goshikiensis TaxID=1942 RepID=UPI0036BE51C9